jgi:hypothetical protein
LVEQKEEMAPFQGFNYYQSVAHILKNMERIDITLALHHAFMACSPQKRQTIELGLVYRWQVSVIL